MIFIDIVSWEPKDQNEVLERFSSWEYPEGIKVIGEWIDLTNCRSVLVSEAENDGVFAAAYLPWRDICYFDSFPAMESSEYMKFLSEHMK